MTFYNAGGGDSSGWGIYAILALIAAPFVLGLVLRLLDRRRGTDGPDGPARPLTWRRWSVRSGVAGVCFIVATVAWTMRVELVAALALLGAAVTAPLTWPERRAEGRHERVGS